MNINDSLKSKMPEWKDTKSNESFSLLNLEPPLGWIYLNKTYIDESFDQLAGRKLPKNDWRLRNFFGGKMQLSFDIALTDSVPRRFYVEQLQKKINEASQTKQFRVTLLVGPGGEGKSTILQQIAIDLVRQTEPKLHVFFRREPNVLLNIKFIEKLLRFQDQNGNSNHTFVFVSDNAHTINDIFKGVETVASASNSQNSIQFLLASRGTHWRWSEIQKGSSWKRLVNDDYEVKIDRLTEDDAKKIVVAWEEADDLTNNLKAKSIEERATFFFNSAIDNFTGNKRKNSFYRAIFKLRRNQTLESYIEEILDGFSKVSAPKNLTLENCFAYIVALHADLGFPLLTKPVLRRALGYDSDEQVNEVLNLLDDEKTEVSILQTGKYILARHDVFAEEVKRILEDKYSPNYFYKILGDLAVAAEHAFRENSFNVGKRENKIWSSLANWYFDKPEDLELNQAERSEKKLKEKELALHIAETLAKEISEEPVLVSAWAELLRRNRETPKAAKVFQNYLNILTPDKGYFFEWGVTQGVLEKPFLSVWLTAKALSDDIEKSKNDDEPPAMRLGSLATAFSKSFEKTNNRDKDRFYNTTDSNTFKKATEATVKLGLNEKALKDARPSFNSGRAHETLNDALTKVSGKLPDMTLEKCFQAIENGINLAWELCESDRKNLPESLSKSPLKFSELKEVFEDRIVSSITVRRLGSLPKSDITCQVEYKANKFPFFYDRSVNKFYDNEELIVDLSEPLINVLKCFFEKEGQGIKSQLTFAEIAEKYKQNLRDEDDETEVARNFQRNLHDQLYKNYGLRNTDAIVKPWHNNGYQLGKEGWDFSKAKKSIDAMERPKFSLDENIAPKSDRKTSSKKPASE